MYFIILWQRWKSDAVQCLLIPQIYRGHPSKHSIVLTLPILGNKTSSAVGTLHAWCILWFFKDEVLVHVISRPCGRYNAYWENIILREQDVKVIKLKCIAGMVEKLDANPIDAELGRPHGLYSFSNISAIFFITWFGFSKLWWWWVEILCSKLRGIN